jgi:putative DNA-invertase from lambdoid prophage Rac
MRALLHARVSTHDQQTVGLQLEMRFYIRGRWWEAVRQVEHIGSGAKERPGREGLLRSARRERIRHVVFSGRPSCSA